MKRRQVTGLSTSYLNVSLRIHLTASSKNSDTSCSVLRFHFHFLSYTNSPGIYLRIHARNSYLLSLVPSPLLPTSNLFHPCAKNLHLTHSQMIRKVAEPLFPPIPLNSITLKKKSRKEQKASTPHSMQLGRELKFNPHSVPFVTGYLSFVHLCSRRKQVESISSRPLVSREVV